MTTSKTHVQQRHGSFPARFAHPSDVRKDMSSLALTRKDRGRSLVVFVVMALLLLAADMLLLRAHSGTYYVDIGNYRDRFFLDDAYFQEVTADGTTYRWSKEHSNLWVGDLGQAKHVLLSLELGGRPDPADLRLTLNDQPWLNFTAHAEPRRYTLLLPPGAPGTAAIGIGSTTFTTPTDPRPLGVQIEGFGVAIMRDSLPLPSPVQLLAQLMLVLAVQLTALRLGWRWRAQALALFPLVLALAALLSGSLLLIHAYLPRMAVAAVVLAALTWILLPIAERKLTWLGDPREIRLLWLLMLLGIAIRLVGVFYPTFGGQDLSLNLKRLFMTLTGQLVIIAKSKEFGYGFTIYPPGPYLALLPGATVIRDFGSLLQGGLATLDGATAFLVAMLVRRLGGNRNAARFGLILYAGSFPAFAAMSYGFSAQIFGQWLTTPLALVLLACKQRPSARAWLLATTILLMGVFSHIGVAILGFTWLGFMVLIMLLRPHRSLWWPVMLVGGGGLLALGLLYIEILEITLSHASTLTEETAEQGVLLPGATPLLWKGFRLAYSDVGLALLPLGAILVARVRRSLEWHAILLAWLLTAVFYLVVDLLLAVQVRYFYFALPLALATIALVLGKLSTRGLGGRIGSWALVLALAFQTIALWYSVTMGDGKMSMTPLTH